jgi:hypothetical protein
MASVNNAVRTISYSSSKQVDAPGKRIRHTTPAFPSSTFPFQKAKKPLISQGFHMERVMGIEPTPPAWEAGVLPLNYTRIWEYGAGEGT